MIEKITVRNYQSLYNVEAELGKFTVLYGNSDVGKSAFYRAIRGLLVGEVGDDFISVETNRVGVSIKTTTGLEVVWLKSRGKSSTYVLFKDGAKVKEWRRARALPPELAEILSFHQVSVDGDKFFPNLRGQFDPLFLLFESSSKRARVLGSLVSNLLLSGIKTANLERNRNEADIRAVSSLAEDLERKMKVNWKVLFDKATSLQAYADVQLSRVASLRDLKADLEYLEVLVDEEEAFAGSLSKLDSVLRDVGKLEEFTEQYEFLFPAVKKWKALKKVQDLKVSTHPPVGIDRLFKLEALLGVLRPLVTQAKVYGRDTFLAGKELIRFNDALGELNVEIRKVKAVATVTCPHCGKEFIHGTE